MSLVPLSGEDPRAVLRALRAALNGSGPALGLGVASAGGLPDAAASTLPAGTAVVVQTSGSTGVPKRVVLGRSALTAAALATAARIGEGAWLLAVPAGYVAGLQVLVRALVQGREPALLAGRFSPRVFAAAARGMASSRGGTPVPTYTSLVPAQLASLLDAAVEDAEVGAALRSFQAVLVGGQALPAALRERAAAEGVRVVRTYGATETCGGCVYDGVALDGVGVRAVDGELRVSGPVLATGYLDDPARTDAAFPADATGRRWYRTGDAGAVEDGVVRVTGRIDNVLVTGGVNVSLDRVEQLVRSIPGLEDAVVVAVPDERWGEASVVVAPRAMAGGRAADELRAAVRDAVAAGIGRHARPARILLVDELPRLASGKPDRRAARALAADA